MITAEPLEQSGSACGNTQPTYAQYFDGRLIYPHELGQPVHPLHEFVHDSFRALVLNPHFACVAAKGAIHRGSYRTGLYREMASSDATMSLARDLYAFLRDQDVMDGQGDGFSTFAASFQGPCTSDEEAFEGLLWKQLQDLHDADAPNSVWDPAVSADPESRDFSFSFGGRAFYVIGLHPAASRWSRRFAWPTLVFNAHAQFDRLKADGRYQPLQYAIRARDSALQGGINPMLGDFGDESEARQYSGRAVGAEWRCPFHAHPAAGRDGA